MRVSGVLAISFFLVGCGTDDSQAIPGPDLSEEAALDGKADSGGAGGLTNTSMLNGRQTNGRQTNGTEYAMTGADLGTLRMPVSAPATNAYPTVAGGSAVTGVHLTNGGILTNAGVNFTRARTTRTGTDLRNALVTGTMSDGKQATLWLKDIYPDPKNASRHLYNVMVYHRDPALVADPTSECARTGRNCERWDYACGTYPTTPNGRPFPVPALAVPGQWNFQSGAPGGGAKTVHIADGGNTRMTFACLNGAIGKCAYWGYEPWRSVAGQSLEPYHETCTRMVRLDYCGDGTSLTSTGVRINVYDPLGVLTDTESWPFESTWNATGGHCGSGARRVCTVASVDARGNAVCKEHSSDTALGYIRKHCPNQFVNAVSSSRCLNQPLITTEYAP